MKAIFFIINDFTERDYERFGFETFKKRNYLVEAWSFLPYLNKSYYDSLSIGPKYKNVTKVFAAKDDIINEISKIQKNEIVILCFLYNEKLNFIYDLLNKRKIRYGSMQLGMIPSNALKANIWIKLKLILSPFTILKKIFTKFKLNKIHINYDFFIYAGKESLSRINKFINQNTKLINSHSFDYDSFLKCKINHNDTNEEYAVFLDENVPFHSDVRILNIEPALKKIKPHKYYSELNRCFTAFEHKYGFKIKILSHPKSNYSNNNNPFQEREIVRNKPLNLVSQSKLVFTHASTAVSYAILFHKPIIIINSSNYNHSFQNSIDVLSQHLGVSSIDISKESYKINYSTNVNNIIYSNYKTNFIKEANSDDILIWEMFCNYLDNND